MRGKWRWGRKDIVGRVRAAVCEVERLKRVRVAVFSMLIDLMYFISCQGEQGAHE